jgi:hypothetical protein
MYSCGTDGEWMSDEQPIESAPADSEPIPEPPEDSSPFEVPPMDVVTAGDEPPNVEVRGGD